MNRRELLTGCAAAAVASAIPANASSLASEMLDAGVFANFPGFVSIHSPYALADLQKMLNADAMDFARMYVMDNGYIVVPLKEGHVWYDFVK